VYKALTNNLKEFSTRSTKTSIHPYTTMHREGRGDQEETKYPEDLTDFAPKRFWISSSSSTLDSTKKMGFPRGGEGGNRQCRLGDGASGEEEAPAKIPDTPGAVIFRVWSGGSGEKVEERKSYPSPLYIGGRKHTRILWDQGRRFRGPESLGLHSRSIWGCLKRPLERARRVREKGPDTPAWKKSVLEVPGVSGKGPGYSGLGKRSTGRARSIWEKSRILRPG